MRDVTIRTEDDIQRELADRREDLAHTVSELGDVMRNKLDLRARARRNLARRQKAAKDLLVRARSTVREQPPPFLIGAGGALLLVVGAAFVFGRRRAPPLRRG